MWEGEMTRSSMSRLPSWPQSGPLELQTLTNSFIDKVDPTQFIDVTYIYVVYQLKTVD